MSYLECFVIRYASWDVLLGSLVQVARAELNRYVA
jgi:hypothetical protein